MVAQLVECLLGIHEILSAFAALYKPGIVMYIYNDTTWEAEGGGMEFKDFVDYTSS